MFMKVKLNNCITFKIRIRLKTELLKRRTSNENKTICADKAKYIIALDHKKRLKKVIDIILWSQYDDANKEITNLEKEIIALTSLILEIENKHNKMMVYSIVGVVSYMQYF